MKVEQAAEKIKDLAMSEGGKRVGDYDLKDIIFYGEKIIV